MAKGSCCCCSMCSSPLPANVSECCLCVCNTICIELQGGSSCACESSVTLIEWDSSECAYIGTASCGTLSIDVRFEVKKCPDGTCRLCLTSTCLGLNGECPASGTGCNAFAPGHKTGDCGKFLRDCDQSGGWDETWVVDAVNCLPVNAPQPCPSVTIRVTCYDRTNPAGSGLTRKCKDCDCVCECVLISYSETDAPDYIPVTSCWDGEWEATLRTRCSPAGPQTVNVVLERDEVTGCCNWKVTITKGIIAAGYPGAGTKIAIIKTECPDVDIELGVDLPEDDIGMVMIDCSSCGPAEYYCVCNCNYLQDKWCNVESLTADIDYPAGCGEDETVVLSHSGASVIVPGGVSDCPQWGVRLTLASFGTFDIAVWCVGDTLRAIIVQQTLNASPCTFGEEGVPVDAVSISCGDDSLEAIFELNVVDNPDPGVLIDCACPGSVLRIRVY